MANSTTFLRLNPSFSESLVPDISCAFNENCMEKTHNARKMENENFFTINYYLTVTSLLFLNK